MTRRFLTQRKPWRQLALAAAAAVMGGAAAPAPRTADPLAFVALLERAEARSAAREWRAAVPLWEEVLAANPTEGLYWHRLGSAWFRLKEWRPAIPALTRAVQLGYGAPENNAYNIAVAYARLGERENALDWLERAYAMQFILFDLPAKEEAFRFLHGEARFRALVPIADTSRMSRVEGWRYDIAHLAREIDRLGEAPYRIRSKAWFDRTFADLVARIPALTDAEVTLAVSRLVRDVGDGHSYAFGSLGPETALSLPLQFQAFEDGLFITAADPRHRDLLGARLLAMDGRSVETLFAGVKPYISRDNEGRWTDLQSAFRLRNTGILHALGLVDSAAGAKLRLRGLDGKVRTATVAADGSRFGIWNDKPHPEGWIGFAAAQPGDLPLYLRDPGRNYWFEHLPQHRTLYLALNRLRDDPKESLSAFSDRVGRFIAENGVERLVIDLRWNNGGNAQLMTPLLAAVLRSERVNRRGRLFVIIGRRVFSAAQVAAAQLERFTEATFVGEPTGSSPNFIGEEDAFTLPWSRMTVNISHLAWQGSMPQDRRAWIAPLLYVPPTFADYRAGRDAALETVLRLPIPEPALSRSGAPSPGPFAPR